MAESGSSAELINQAIEALNIGDRVHARALLSAALRLDPGNARAWLWLSGAVDSPLQQRECLARVLALDPRNVAAQRGLQALDIETKDERRKTKEAVEARPSSEHRQTINEAALARPSSVVQRPSSNPSPWLLIWFRPRLAIEQAIRARHVLEPGLLSALAGVNVLLSWAAWRRLGAELSIPQLLLITLLAGVPLGLAGMVIGAVLLRSAGRWLGGRASTSDLRLSLAWAAAPSIFGLIIWGGELFVLPGASFGGPPAAAEPDLAPACIVAHALLACWSAGLLIVGVAAAHRFSLRRAIGAWILAALLVLGAGLTLFAGSAFVIALRGG